MGNQQRSSFKMENVQRPTLKQGVGDSVPEVEGYPSGRRYGLLSYESTSGCQAHRVEVTTLLDNRFDGDALNTSLLIDNFMGDGLRDMAPYKSALNLEAVREISGDMIIPKPVVSVTSNYMSKPAEPIITPMQNEFMKQIQA